MPYVPRVKICCISSLDEARLAVAYGACAIGLVSAMPSGPGVIPEALIREIAISTPPGVDTFLLTAKQDLREVIAQQRLCATNTVQLVDFPLFSSYDSFRREIPGIRIVQVVHVRGEEAIEEALRVAPEVDAILLDSGNPELRVKVLGGTGRTHDWAISRRIVEAVDRPVFLAGGLTPDNVAEAIRLVRPFGVDVCSGVRTGGKLDEAKLAAFFEAVRAAAL